METLFRLSSPFKCVQTDRMFCLPSVAPFVFPIVCAVADDDDGGVKLESLLRQ